MIYRAIGLMSGSSLDGLDIVFAEIHENGGRWSYSIVAADCYPYSAEWASRLQSATSLNALDYQLLHAEYGAYLGAEVNRFIGEKGLDYKVALVSSHGHTTFHVPAKRMTAQLGDGAAIAAATKLPVVSDLRAMDVALGGQGAPIVPIGEQLLLSDYNYFLNLGGIANISRHTEGHYAAFDVCAANRVLNMLAQTAGHTYDAGGQLAASGEINKKLLEDLDGLSYYQEPSPKSLANDFGTDTVYPIIQAAGLSVNDALRTYTEHIARQIAAALLTTGPVNENAKLLVTGGGALNTFLIERLRVSLDAIGIEVEVPADELVNYKEALIMALIGVLRWREENNVLSSVTGASRNSVGGAMWMGQG